MACVVAVIHWDHLPQGGLPVNDGVESVDGVSGVLDGANSAVRFHQAVAALHDAALSCLVLRLRITRQSVLHTVAEAVLRVGVGVLGYVVRHGIRQRRVSAAGGGYQEGKQRHDLQNE